MAFTKLPNNMAMMVLRLRLGVGQFDESKDEIINAYTPRQAFEEVVAWHFGSPDHADDIFAWLRNCGFDVVERK